MKTRKNTLRRHVYICFWGLTRSLKYTLDSITEVLNRFPNRTVFLHTYELDELYSNPQGKEYNIQLNKDEWKLLNPDYHIVDNQREVLSRLNVEQYRSSGDPWNSDFKVLDNFILGMYSLKRVTELMMENSKGYKRVIFMRPDVKFIKGPTNSMVETAERNTIVVPKFHSWSYTNGITKPYGGVNDRFAICSYSAAKIYGLRFNSLLEYSKHYPPHSETFLRDYLSAKGISVNKSDICFHRIRATGQELDDC
jgi:hypothetical protein